MDFNVDTEAQKHLLRYAAGKSNLDSLKKGKDEDMFDQSSAVSRISSLSI